MVNRIFSVNAIYGLIQTLIIFIIGIYIESIASDKLLLTEGWLAEGVRQSILASPKTVLLVLGALNLLLFFQSHRDRLSAKEAKTYNNICKEIFNKFIDKNGDLSNRNVRVSLFLPRTELDFEKKLFNKEVNLRLVGRFETKQNQKKTKIKFLTGEGCVGICYEFGEIIQIEIAEFNKTNPSRYYADSLNTFNLNKNKLDSVNSKYCSFLAMPLKYFGSVNVFAVLVIDCLERGKITKLNPRDIERCLENYSVFFEQEQD